MDIIKKHTCYFLNLIFFSFKYFNNQICFYFLIFDITSIFIQLINSTDFLTFFSNRITATLFQLLTFIEIKQMKTKKDNWLVADFWNPKNLMAGLYIYSIDLVKFSYFITKKNKSKITLEIHAADIFTEKTGETHHLK